MTARVTKKAGAVELLAGGVYAHVTFTDADPDQRRLELEEAASALHEMGQYLATMVAPAPPRPTVVCLCGSTRFWRQFQRSSLEETMAGNIVLSIGAATGTDDEHFGNLPAAEYARIKEDLDQLHLRKIELADEILVLNVGGYIGTSTRRELNHARSLGKRVRFLEVHDDPA